MGKTTRAGTILCAGAAALTIAVAAAAGTAQAPPASALGRSLAAALEGRAVTASGGARIELLGPEDAPEAFLTPSRLRTCLATIAEADAWPDVWLVVQDHDRPDDLLLHLRRSGDEVQLASPPVVAERIEWTPREIRDAVRKGTGRKPRVRNVVMQGFTTKIVRRYVYRAPAGTERAGGILALLPAGSTLREARSVDLGDGKRHTLAVVLVNGEFVPSSCETETQRETGHVDEGTILLALAGEEKLDATLDLTPYLASGGAPARLPRYPCLPEDESAGDVRTVEERFAAREPVRLIHFRDLDGDGLPLELAIPRPGSALPPVVVRLLPTRASLEIVPAPEPRPGT